MNDILEEATQLAITLVTAILKYRLIKLLTLLLEVREIGVAYNFG